MKLKKKKIKQLQAKKKHKTNHELKSKNASKFIMKIQAVVTTRVVVLLVLSALFCNMQIFS